MDVDAPAWCHLEQLATKDRRERGDADQIGRRTDLSGQFCLLRRMELADFQSVTSRRCDERRRAEAMSGDHDRADLRATDQCIERGDRSGTSRSKEEDAHRFRVYSAAVRFARRFIYIVLGLALLIVAGWLLMPFMARRLIRSDRLDRADLIVVPGSMRLERTLEAGMLYREGWAPRIMLLRPPDIVRDSLSAQLGVRVPLFIDIQKDALLQMHVPLSAIEISPKTRDSTHGEAELLASYVRQSGYRKIIIVTSPYHTARAGSLFENAARGSCQFVVHPDRYEPIDPDRWWLHFPDRTDVVLEYLKRIYALFFR